MALQQQTVKGKLEILENGVIQVREDTYIIDDTNNSRVFGPRYHRYTLVPGQDVTGELQWIQRICNIVWTPAVIAAYQASQNA